MTDHVKSKSNLTIEYLNDFKSQTLQLHMEWKTMSGARET